MKTILLSLFIFCCIIPVSHAQQNNDDWDKTALSSNTNNLILGIFNPDNFSMNHTFNISMLNTKYGSVSVTSYVNSLNYKLNDDLNVSADISLSYSPYANSVLGSDFSSKLQNDLSGISLSRLAVDYKISENAFIKFEYRNVKNSIPYDNFGYYDPVFRR